MEGFAMKNQFPRFLFPLILIIIICFTSCSLIKINGNSTLSSSSISINSYAPLSSLPQKYTTDMAIKNGDYVHTYKEKYNEDKLDKFIEDVRNKKKAIIRTVMITTEGNPIITDVNYDGTLFNLIVDTTRDKFGNNGIESNKYNNLIECKYNGKTYYYITDETQITEEMFNKSIKGYQLAVK
jgi:hypothetical protein